MGTPESSWVKSTWSSISAGSKAADEAAEGRGAEGAAHGAADLRGDADGIAVMIAHQDGLDTVAVSQAPEVFDRPIPG